MVYPLPCHYMDFEYKPGKNNLKIEKRNVPKNSLDTSLTPLLNKALKIANKKEGDLKGALTIDSFIPFGAGLGASAVICSGIADLFSHKTWIPKNQLNTFAVSLEDFFHGKSSGMDIAAVLGKKPVLYQKGQALYTLPKCKFKTGLFLSYTGGNSLTSVGVSKVKQLFERNRNLAERIDKSMSQSVKLCLSALEEENKNKRELLLKQALDLGANCFQEWGLISSDLKKHEHFLKKQGALAVKPTGSGLGGYMISLWNKNPPSSLIKKLIPLDI